METMLIGAGVGLAIGGFVTLITQRGKAPARVGPTMVRLLVRIGAGFALALAMTEASGVFRALLMILLLAAAFGSIATMLRRTPVKALRRIAIGAGVGFGIGAITSLVLTDNGTATAGSDLVRIECSSCDDLTELTLIEDGLQLTFSSASRPVIHLWSEVDPFDPLTLEPDGSVTAMAQSDTWNLDQLRIGVSGSSITVIVDPAAGLAVTTSSGERLPSDGYVSATGVTQGDTAGQSLYSTLAPDSQRLWTLLGHATQASSYTAWAPPSPGSVAASTSASGLCAADVCIAWQPGLWMVGLSSGTIDQISDRDLGGERVRCFAVSATTMPDGEWCFTDDGELAYLDNRRDHLIFVRGGS